jgi:DNA-binding transcriptional MocR family regulator
MTVPLQYRPAGATATEIANSVEVGIREGDLRAGDTLSPVRQLAAELNVSPATVASAYRILRERGMVTTQERSRTRIAARPPLMARMTIPVPDSVRDLASGNPDPALLPSLERAVRGLALPPRLYGEAGVLPELADLARTDLGAYLVDTEHLAVVSGGLDGIERVLTAHLKPGDQVAVEDPCYTGVLDLVRAMNFAPRAIAIDEHGPLPDAVDAVLSAGVETLVLTPRCQNPTGAALTEQRAADLREVLARHPRVLVVEDDHAGDTTTVPRHSVIEDRERWAVVRSIAKSLGPDLRLAVLVGDTITVGRVEGRQLLGCGWVSHVLQRVVSRLWSDNAIGEQLRAAAAAYDERRDSLLAALAELDIAAIGRSGFNVWVPVDEEEPVVRGLLHLGWAIRGGEAYRIESAPGIRVTTSTLKQGEAEAFAADLASVIRTRSRTRLA